MRFAYVVALVASTADASAWPRIWNALNSGTSDGGSVTEGGTEPATPVVSDVPAAPAIPVVVVKTPVAAPPTTPAVLPKMFVKTSVAASPATPAAVVVVANAKAAATSAAPKAETTRAPTTPTPPRVYTVAMTANFEFGLPGRSPVTTLPVGVQVACPRDRDYCIDTRNSGADVCMHPSPLTIKKCLDHSCEVMPGSEQIFKQYGEDSYCKDFQLASGRVCHWTTTPCTCNSMDLSYVVAVKVTALSPAPSNYRVTRPCEYADNYKGVNKRESDAQPATKRPTPVGANQTPKGAVTLLATALFIAFVF